MDLVRSPRDKTDKQRGHSVINLDDSGEVKYWTRRLKVSRAELERLVAALGKFAVPHRP